jgi:hypothetical protein
MKPDLTDDETDALGCSATQSTPIVTRCRRGSKCRKAFSPRSDPRQNPSHCRHGNIMNRREPGDTGDGEGQLFPPAYDARELRRLHMWPDRVVPPLRGASPSASLTASPGATRLRRVPELPLSSRARYGVTSCRRRWHKCRSRCEAPDGAIADGFASRNAAKIRPETPVPEWRKRLVSSHPGATNTDMVVIEERR